MFINIQVNMPPNDLHWVIYLIQYRKILTKVQPSWPLVNLNELMLFMLLFWHQELLCN